VIAAEASVVSASGARSERMAGAFFMTCSFVGIAA